MAEHKGSGSRGGITLVILALMFIIGSIVLPAGAGGSIPRESQLLLIGFGIILMIIALIMMVITRLYHQASAAQVALWPAIMGMGACAPETSS